MSFVVFLTVQCSSDSPKVETWELIAPFEGSHRLYSATFAIGTSGYVTLGRELTSDKLDLWEYESKTDTWTKRKDFESTGREDAVGFAIGGKGYVGTGNGSGTRRDDFWSYDPATDDWSQVDSYPGGTRERLVAFVLNGKAYVGLGDTYTQNTFVWYNDFYEFDPSKTAGSQWTRKADIGGDHYPDGVPTAAGKGFAFAIGNKGYIGIDKGGEANTACALWEYDPSNNSWTQKASIPTGLGYAQGKLVAMVIGGKAYLQSTTSVLQYDPAKNTWKKFIDYPVADSDYTIGFVIGKNGYIGMPVGSNEFYKFHP